MPVPAAIRALHIPAVARRHIARRLLSRSPCCSSRRTALTSPPRPAYKPTSSTSTCRLVTFGLHEGEDLELVWDGLVVKAWDVQDVVGLLKGVSISTIIGLVLSMPLLLSVLNVAYGIFNKLEWPSPLRV